MRAELLAQHLRQAPYSDAWNGYEKGHVVSPELHAALLEYLNEPAPGGPPAPPQGE